MESRTVTDGTTPMGEGASQTGLDLGALFDGHIAREFADQDVSATMDTMVPEPYVHCVPTMMGGIGGDGVRRFYSEHFVNQIPKDAQVIRISRTVGKDRVVDELIVSFTHDAPWDYLLPGIPPTGKRVELPHVVVMKFENGKVAHEHIYWDQASLLVQVAPSKGPDANGSPRRELGVVGGGAAVRLIAAPVEATQHTRQSVAAVTSSSMPQMRMTPAEVRANQTGTEQIGSSGLAGVTTKVLFGDPAKPGFYTIVLSVPAHTSIAAHSHRDDRMAVVVSGTWQFGYGNRFDEGALKNLPVGSVYSEPGHANHFARTGNDPVLVEISGFGPTDTVYVNPVDTPKP
jgi:carboxymethylenebutenolidase